MRSLEVSDDDVDRIYAEADARNGAIRDRLMADAQWVAAHQGQCVAIAEGVVVDSDSDMVALQYRVGERFSDIPCLLFSVGVEADTAIGPSPLVAENDDDAIR